MIDRNHEQIIPLREVPNYLPSRMLGKKLSFATVWRWALRSKDPLETFCTPGGRFTSIEALDRFIEQCSSKKLDPGTRSLERDAHERARRAGVQLRALIGGRHGR